MARRNVIPKGPIWPSWRYGPDGGSGIFYREEDIPLGWTTKLGVPEIPKEEKPTVVLDRNELVAELIRQNIPIKPTWGNAHMKRIIDGDSSPTW